MKRDFNIYNIKPVIKALRSPVFSRTGNALAIPACARAGKGLP